MSGNKQHSVSMCCPGPATNIYQEQPWKPVEDSLSVPQAFLVFGAPMDTKLGIGIHHRISQNFSCFFLLLQFPLMICQMWKEQFTSYLTSELITTLWNSVDWEFSAYNWYTQGKLFCRTWSFLLLLGLGNIPLNPSVS